MARSLRRKEFRPPVRGMLERSRSGWAAYRSPIAEEVKFIPFNMKRIGKTVERVVHGLHFHETGRVLPQSYRPKVIDNGVSRRMPSFDLPYFQGSSPRWSEHSGSRSATGPLGTRSRRPTTTPMPRCGRCRFSGHWYSWRLLRRISYAQPRAMTNFRPFWASFQPPTIGIGSM